ncbi:putative flagellar protein [Nautilia profundicola AmH]|uniref:Flagellar protein n=1 Tax=Nautilia profundicola (strain ATCC BAA-1463 / DSM 18972 / AmH) TaxID=598659 RepID=B9L6K1_NAUPA|nr:hypothetical protein [Nautilia profundicola]ACM92563.1 putative flagellar protein [Nautilia profundicola AmH]
MENGKWKIDKKVFIVCKECEQKYTDIPIIKINNENEFFDVVRRLKPKEVVVDNYNFTYEDEKKFKELFPNIKLICFDDMYKKHCCDEIINHNLGVNINKYDDPKKVKVIKPLVGENFIKAKKKYYKKEGVFISFGGTDAKGIGLKVLKQLKDCGLKVDFYTTSANKHLEKLKKFCFLNRWCRLHIDEDVAVGMAKAKFGVITPSTIAYEAIYMGLGFIAVQVAENQENLVKYLKSKKYKVLKKRDINGRKIKKSICRVSRNRGKKGY